MRRICLVVIATVVLAGCQVTSGPASTSCGYPADVLNLTNWKVTLPIGSQGKPTEVKPPALATYDLPPWFQVAPGCAGVQFRAPVNAVTTSGSTNPRSELREMTAGGEDEAAWSSTEGTHTMVISQAITRLPTRRPYVVAGQVHNATDDLSVFRLEGTKLYITNGNNLHHQLVTARYRLGTRFEAKFVVSGGEIKVFYNGFLKTTIANNFVGAYFKAGAYPQANCTNSSPCDESNFGEVVIYNLTVTHS